MLLHLLTDLFYRLLFSVCCLLLDLKQSELKREQLEAQSRRENLQFYGIKEDRDETWKDSGRKIRDYIEKDLELNASRIRIDRAHRMKSGQKPYPIIAKFSFFKEKEEVEGISAKAKRN